MAVNLGAASSSTRKFMRSRSEADLGHSEVRNSHEPSTVELAVPATGPAGELHWVLWTLRGAPGFARSACLISDGCGGVTDLVFDGREHAERRVSPLPVVEVSRRTTCV